MNHFMLAVVIYCTCHQFMSIIWISAFQHSSTLSQLLKVVEDFGEAFTKYLECDNKTESEKTFSLDNISKPLL